MGENSMRKLIILFAAVGLLMLFGEVYAGDVYVNPYIRSDGTFVPGHYRSSPDGNVGNNWRENKTLGSSLFVHPGSSTGSLREPPRPTTQSITISEYSCESTSSKDGKTECMTFSRSGKIIRSDCTDSVDYLKKFKIFMSPPAGTDINRDGFPEIIIEHYSGGMHCCYEYAIFSLGKKLKLLDVIYGEHSYFEFKDLDGDGRYEAIGRDWTFAYWSASFAESPAPEVILRWKNGKYRLAGDLMKKQYDQIQILETAEEFRRNALPISESNQSLHFDTEWYAAMLELIYTGNGNLAWELCDRFWPIPDDDLLKKKWVADKRRFLAGFKAQLRKSIYWSDLKKMNGWH
jgi:hypothetical protein